MNRERQAIAAAKSLAERVIGIAPTPSERAILSALVERGIAARLADRSAPVPLAGCWLWTGPVAPGGYGKASIGSMQVFIHRISFELFNGPLPDGMVVCHECDVPACWNPAHLFAGTETDNRLDMIRKGRRIYSVPTHCPAGHEYAGENLYVRPGTSYRQCRTCKTAHNAARYQRSKTNV